MAQNNGNVSRNTSPARASKEIAPAERVRMASQREPAVTQDKAREAKEKWRHGSDEVFPEVRVRETAQRDPEVIRENTRLANERGHSTKGEVTPEERVNKAGVEATSSGNEQQVEPRPHESALEPSNQEPADKASATGLPGFGGKMPP